MREEVGICSFSEKVIHLLKGPRTDRYLILICRMNCNNLKYTVKIRCQFNEKVKNKLNGSQ